MRAGDTVKHRQTGETWVLAYAEGGRVSWCGWPEGAGYAHDCEVVKPATDAEHRAMLERWAKKDNDGDHRSGVCRRQLADLNRAYVGAGI